MRIAIIGYGKMGQLIEKLATEKGHEIVYKIDSHNTKLTANLENIDVAIEFTHPEIAVSNYKKLAGQNIPIVTGTTGWTDNFDEVEKLIQDTGNRFFYASNFSIGVHLAMATSNYLAKLTENFPEYSVRIDEWHHTAKKDAPSGTALSFGREIINNHKGYKKISTEPTDIQEGELPIYAYRENDIPGTHQIKYDSEIDSIILRHEAKNRQGFALGAIKAAEFLVNQKPGVYTMNDLIKLPL
ncbi:4-hydroxy-tetrahydrodipicolinate reductase [Cryomorpha ignava]|uniref:4-hydroxy-tetrahydrodipicolinate reductase n=1 Tax=Cryomorpha ignava TaxID=101383 RepID=A0A7K3WWQ4_9FLAO|nr:4-hydroxy-tetrahydrodipicolinate reductase [Cryomorpha ignava]NEN25481.1 4-hydroxy-tetrahydrodipicolinate reductase [Cryomorpha ignava]